MLNGLLARRSNHNVRGPCRAPSPAGSQMTGGERRPPATNRHEVISMPDWTPWTTGPDADRWSALLEHAVARGAHHGRPRAAAASASAPGARDRTPTGTRAGAAGASGLWWR